MSRPLVIVRPEPGCSETLAAAQALGLPAIAAPLFAIMPVRWEAPEAQDFDAILAGSANVFRHGGTGLAALRALPVHAVGSRTADAARAAGFAVASVGEGGLQPLVAGLAGPLRLLRLAGEARVELTPPLDVRVADRVVYRAEPLPLAPAAVTALDSGGAALLHSGEAARRFASDCDRLGLSRARIAIAALAPRIADAAGEGWRAVSVAQNPTDSALLAIAGELCQ